MLKSEGKVKETQQHCFIKEFIIMNDQLNIGRSQGHRQDRFRHN